MQPFKYENHQVCNSWVQLCQDTPAFPSARVCQTVTQGLKHDSQQAGVLQEERHHDIASCHWKVFKPSILTMLVSFAGAG